MSWSYDDPSSSSTDAVRFLIGDTDESDPLLSDEEIEYALSTAGGSVYQAAHDACYAIASKMSRMATSKSVGDLSLSYANRAQAFRDQAERLLELAARRDIPTPWVNPDALKRSSEKAVLGTTGTEFYTGQHDYYRG